MLSEGQSGLQHLRRRHEERQRLAGAAGCQPEAGRRRQLQREPGLEPSGDALGRCPLQCRVAIAALRRGLAHLQHRVLQ